jgi:hypothetical protein
MESVSVAPTKTSLSVSANPVLFSQPLVLTATVSPAFSGAGAPTGTVIFSIDGSVVGFGQLDASGQATLTVSSTQTTRHRSTGFTPLLRGTHQLTVSYAGDGNFAASVSTPLTLTVV